MSKKKRRAAKHRKKEKQPTCDGCGQPLGIPGGYGGTGLCGPCCTGEADTITEMGETW